MVIAFLLRSSYRMNSCYLYVSAYSTVSIVAVVGCYWIPVGTLVITYLYYIVLVWQEARSSCTVLVPTTQKYLCLLTSITSLSLRI